MSRSVFVALCSIILAVAGCEDAAEPGPAVGLKFSHELSAPDQRGPDGRHQLEPWYGVPRPTLYVVDRSGTIRLRYMEPTYRTRPDLDAVLRDAAAVGLSGGVTRLRPR